MRATDHGSLGNGLVPVEHLFHHARVDVHPVHNDQIFNAVNDVKIVILVFSSKVAGAEPFPEKRLCCFLRMLPVAFHHIRAAHADFADLSTRLFCSVLVHDFHLNTGNRRADGARLAQAADGVDAGDG